MALRFSTGLRNYLLGTGDLVTGLNGGILRIYSGALPTVDNGSGPVISADGAALNTACLAKIYSDGGVAGGTLSFATPLAGATSISKTGATWDNSVEKNLVGGTATYFIYACDAAEASGDIAESTTAKRILGTVGGAGSGADLIVSNTVLEGPTPGPAGVQAINSFVISIPESVGN